MSYDRASVLEAYARTSSLRGACAETGCPPYVAYIWCKKAGVLALHDKTKYGTRASQMGALAEKEFQRLVPRAMPANAALDPNCPSFDFDIDGLTVDVKYSSIRSTGGWCFKKSKHKPMQPDLYAAFFTTDPSGKLEKGYHLFLIPHDVVSDRTNIWLSPGSASELWQFEVAPESLAKVLEGNA